MQCVDDIGHIGPYRANLSLELLHYQNWHVVVYIYYTVGERVTLNVDFFSTVQRATRVQFI